MKKQEFLKELRKFLKNIRKKEREDYIRRYDELLSDMMENGMSEEEAVHSLGNVKDIAAELMQDMNPDSRKKKDKILVLFLLADLVLFGINVFQFFTDRFIGTLFLTKTQGGSAASVVIGGADGPTSVFIAGKVSNSFNFLLAAMVCMMVVTLIYVILKGRKKRH